MVDLCGTYGSNGPAIETHSEYVGGANNTGALCGLLTVFGMPITTTLAIDADGSETVDAPTKGGTLL